MTPELTALALAALLQVVQFVLYAVPANLELGSGYTMSARDKDPSRQMSERTARLGRALANHFEGLILFTIAVVVVTSRALRHAHRRLRLDVPRRADPLHPGLCLCLAPGPVADLGCGVPGDGPDAARRAGRRLTPGRARTGPHADGRIRGNGGTVIASRHL